MAERDSVFHPNYICNSLIQRQLTACADYFGGVLLDLGCGESPYLTLVKDKAERYIGVDYFPEDISRGTSIVARGESLPLKDSSVDTVLCTEVLEHVPIPDLLMEEIRRVLKPERYVVLTVPMVWCLHHKPHDYQRFTGFGLEYLLKQHKFEIIKIERRGNFWLTVGQMLNYYINYSFSSSPGKGVTFGRLAHRTIRSMRKCIFALNYYVFSFLDRFDRCKLDTLGYLAVGRKKESPENQTS